MRTEAFDAVVPGQGRFRFRNLVARKAGLSQRTIVVMAHRDDAGTGPGANDNASGTAALIELARTYAPRGRPGPDHASLHACSSSRPTAPVTARSAPPSSPPTRRSA